MEIFIQPLQRTLNVAVGVNLLDALRANDVPVSYSCLAGRCGTCRCKVVEGQVLDSGWEAQRPLAAEGQYVLACQTHLTESCIVEIPEPDEVVVHTAKIVKATVVAVEDQTHDIKRIRLKPAKPIEFSPGQYAQLQFTPDHIRPYSMAGLCADGELEFHVRLVADGRVTGYIANTLKVGDAVRVSGPLGSAYLRRKHEGPMLCVAGGTGLAPILSIIRRVLRIETTCNDISFFKHHRKVEHRDGHSTRELASLKKSIYSVIDLCEIMLGCNQRYLAFLDSLDDTSAGQRDLQRLSQPRVSVGSEQTVKGLNFFDPAEQRLLKVLQHGKFNIHGWRRADLLALVPMTASALSRQLARPKSIGLIKKVAHTYRYYLTRLGRSAIAAACSITRFNIIPAMAQTA